MAQSEYSVMSCAALHGLLRLVPVFDDPDDVPFKNGLYFFYEKGEESDHAMDGRVVRVGNHPRAQHRLKDRLWDHYSPNKNFSVFRKFIGGALLRRDDPGDPCLRPAPGKGHWERQGEPRCPRCEPLEDRVTDLLRTRFTFRCIEVEDQAVRNALERRIIGSLSACGRCRPSASWLGRHAYSERVRAAGLWNSDHVEGVDVLTPSDLEVLDDLVRRTPREPRGLR